MILGITGGICTGKSTATAVIEAQGARIIDCDEISRYLANYDPAIIKAIRDHFGKAVFHPRGALNRAAIAAVVFKDDAQRIALEGILHPPIKTVVNANIELAVASRSPLVVVAPLLIEADMTDEIDCLWVISCSREHQLSRLCQRTRMDEQQASEWIDSQMPVEEKEKYADNVIKNDGTIEEFQNSVARHWEAFLRENG